MPRMSSRLDRIDPSSEAWTMRISFLTRAMMKMMSSTALPNVTLSSAPIVSPSLLATLSVACDSSPARGMMAMAFMAKTMPADVPAKLTAIPTGTNTSSTLTQL